MAVTETPHLGAALLSAAMALPCLLNPAMAESAPDRGFMSFKYLDYQDSQKSPSGERIKRVRVKAPAVLLMVPINSEWSVMGGLMTDSVSGASPSYHTMRLGKLHDFRRAVDASVTRYLPDGTVTVGLNYSSESDYVSRGGNVLATRSSDDKNTVWSLGLSTNHDQINPVNLVVTNEKKQAVDLLLGVTQVISPQDIVQLNMSFYSGKGYFSDPYKIFDERPRSRTNQAVTGRWNHHFESTDTTSRLAYRYYTDSWGVRSHTLDTELVQSLSSGWSMAPSIRLYTQTAADFYVDVDPTSDPFPTIPLSSSFRYSEDQRLSAFGAYSLGFKLVKQINEDTRVDLKVERYAQRGSWSAFGSGSTGLAPFYARSVQVGLTHWF